MNELLDSAMQYRKLGLSVITTDSLKQSVFKWKDFKSNPATKEQLIRMLNHPATHSLAVITGTISGNLEVIDIDSKYDLGTQLLGRLLFDIEEFNYELAKSLVMVKSRSGGLHLYYRCQEIEPNQPLARRPTTQEEKAIHPKEKIKVLIETRGQGGYVIVPPSPGYKFLQHDFSRVPEISPTERNIILTSARSFNQYQEKRIERRPPKIYPSCELTPFDDYNLRGDVIGLLQKHGWTVVNQTAKRTLFKRPGDTDKRSSGSFNHDLNYFSVFSTSTEFIPRAGYNPYAVYTMLECGGNYQEAVKQLSKEGYGQPSTQHGQNKKDIQRQVKRR